MTCMWRVLVATFPGLQFRQKLEKVCLNCSTSYYCQLKSLNSLATLPCPQKVSLLRATWMQEKVLRPQPSSKMALCVVENLQYVEKVFHHLELWKIFLANP